MTTRRRIDAELLANLVSAADIARRIGVGSSAVANWAVRGIGFPDPVVRLKYDWREVEAWLNVTGRRAPTAPATSVTPEHEALHAHRKGCLVCARSLDRRKMCTIGQQLRDDVLVAGNRIASPIEGDRFGPQRWRP